MAMPAEPRLAYHPDDYVGGVEGLVHGDHHIRRIREQQDRTELGSAFLNVNAFAMSSRAAEPSTRLHLAYADNSNARADFGVEDLDVTG